MQQIHEHLWEEMRRSQGVEEEGANRGWVPALNIQERSQVWLDAWHIQTMRPTLKLNWKPLGPSMVVRRISPYVYELKLPVLIRIHRVQPIALLDPVGDDPREAQAVKPPPPVAVDGGEVYQVSTVEGGRMYRNQLQYLVRWTGYDSVTWEPAKCVDGLQPLGEFHQCYPMKPGLCGHLLGGRRT